MRPNDCPDRQCCDTDNSGSVQRGDDARRPDAGQCGQRPNHRDRSRHNGLCRRGDGRNGRSRCVRHSGISISIFECAPVRGILHWCVRSNPATSLRFGGVNCPPNPAEGVHGASRAPHLSLTGRGTTGRVRRHLRAPSNWGVMTTSNVIPHVVGGHRAGGQRPLPWHRLLRKSHPGGCCVEVA